MCTTPLAGAWYGALTELDIHVRSVRITTFLLLLPLYLLFRIIDHEGYGLTDLRLDTSTEITKFN